MAGSFVKYPKIPESTRQLSKFDESELQKLDTVEWIATEKVHGANFCFLCDGAEIRCAKRTGILGTENFFGHRAVLRKLSERVFNLFERVRRGHPDITCIHLHGELFGGAYDHPDIASDPNFQPVQTGIQYCPHVEFFAFDLAISASKGASSFLGYDEAADLLDSVGVNFLQPLFLGSLNDCLNYPIEFETTIPELLGLPPLQRKNLAEGVVVKPARHLEILSRNGNCFRPFFKVKNPEFSEERRNLEFDLDPRREGASTGGVGDLDVLKWEAFSFVTECRLVNIISKLGFREEGQRSQSRKLFTMMVDDVLEDLQDNHQDMYDALDQYELKELKQEVSGLVKKLLSECLRGGSTRV